MSEPAIETEGLVMVFGDTRAVDGVDLRVSRGGVHGFLGPNGAGRTTTIRSTTGELLRFHRAMLAGELFEHPATIEVMTEHRNRLRNVPVLQYGLGTMSSLGGMT